MAGACYPERYQAISFHLGHLLVPSLHKDGRSRTGIYRQLGQYGYPGSVRLECIRFILLCFRIYRLSDTGPLSGKIPAAMELEKNPGYRYPYVCDRVRHHFRRLPHHAGIFSGKLRLSGNSMAFRRHQCIYDDISCFCLHTEA